jgi:hypothetical protein
MTKNKTRPAPVRADHIIVADDKRTGVLLSAIIYMSPTHGLSLCWFDMEKYDDPKTSGYPPTAASRMDGPAAGNLSLKFKTSVQAHGNSHLCDVRAMLFTDALAEYFRREHAAGRKPDCVPQQILDQAQEWGLEASEAIRTAVQSQQPVAQVEVHARYKADGQWVKTNGANVELQVPLAGNAFDWARKHLPHPGTFASRQHTYRMRLKVEPIGDWQYFALMINDSPLGSAWTCKEVPETYWMPLKELVDRPKAKAASAPWDRFTVKDWRTLARAARRSAAAEMLNDAAENQRSNELAFDIIGHLIELDCAMPQEG